MPVRAFVALGSNLDDPQLHVRAAVRALGTLPGTRLVACSSLYRNPAIGPGAQGDYVNAVAELATALGPLGLLERLQGIEAAHGRRRGPERWAARTLDLDLLLYGGERIDHPRLTVPHPRLAERAFVLVPLAELDSGLCVPGMGPVQELLAACPAHPLARIAPPPDDDAEPAAEP